VRFGVGTGKQENREIKGIKGIGVQRYRGIGV
jgi:hypothetical protein